MQKDKETMMEWDKTICHWPFFWAQKQFAFHLPQLWGNIWAKNDNFPLAGLTTFRKDH